MPFTLSCGRGLRSASRLSSLSITLFLVLAVAGVSQADTLVFQQGLNGYTGAADTYLESLEPTTSHGSDSPINWDGSSGGGTEHCLLRFGNIFGEGSGLIPPGAIIMSATLTYDVKDAGDPGSLCDVLVPWDENTTYSNFGGDSGIQSDEYRTPPVATMDGSSTDSMTVDVTASLSIWSANPAANYGWIVVPTDSNGVQIRSREASTVSERPKLTVEFIPPVPHIRFGQTSVTSVMGSAGVAVPVIVYNNPGSQDVHVTLTSSAPGVASFAGGAASTVLTFAPGASNQQSVVIYMVGVGSATITTTNDGSLLDATLPVTVEVGSVSLNTDYIAAAQHTDLPLKVSITPGSNQTRTVEVTIASDNAAVAQVLGSAAGQKVVTFAAGGPAEQNLTLDVGMQGSGMLSTTNNAGMTDASLNVDVFDGFAFTVTTDTHDNATDPNEFLALLKHMNSTGGPGRFMLSCGDTVPPLPVENAIKTAFGNDFPFYVVMSNHLAETSSGAQWVRDQFPRLLNIVNTGPTGCANTTYSFDWGNAHFVAINQYFDGTSDRDGSGDVIPVVRNWLDADLAATTKKWSFVFGHEPAFPRGDDTYGDARHVGDSLDQFPANRDAFWAVLDEHDVVSTFSGHTHRYSRYLKDGVWQVDCGQAQRPQGKYETYLRVFVGEDSVVFQAYRSLDRPIITVVDSWTATRTSMPRIAVSTQAINRSVRLGQNLPADTISISNSSIGTLIYSIASSEDWLTVSPASGESSGELDIISLSYAVDSLTAGVHNATLTIQSPEASNSPQLVQVRVDVQPAKCDFDADGDVDMDDFAHLQACLSGSAIAQYAAGCQNARLDDDLDVDFTDMSILQSCLSGANIPAPLSCN